MEQKRKYLAISAISTLGMCETRLARLLFKKPSPTPAMKLGLKAHEKLIEGRKKLTIWEMVELIKSGSACAVREIPVLDKRLMITGRMDELRFDSAGNGGKRAAILIDDKFSRIVYEEIPMHYKLQLAAYGAAVDNSEMLSSICIAEKAMLVCRDQGTKEVTNTLEVGKDQFSVWKSNVPKAASLAWDIYNQKKEPEHKRYDVVNGESTACHCREYEDGGMEEGIRI
jgi:hypothetical protein